MRQSSIRKLWQLPAQEKWLLLQVVILLPFVSLGLRLFGFRRMQEWMGHTGSRRRPLLPDARRQARRVAAIVRLVVARLPFVTCLPHSLTLWWLLQQQGIAGELLVGVRMQEGQFQAHAWVELEGEALNDRGDVRQRFAPFDKALAQRRRS